MDTWNFHPKEYGWFRDMMDDNFLEEEIQNLIDYLILNDLDHSNEIEDFGDIKIGNELKEFLERGNTVYIPEIADTIQNIPNNSTIIGGGLNECLQEILYLFNTFQKTYKLNQKFIYG